MVLPSALFILKVLQMKKVASPVKAESAAKKVVASKAKPAAKKPAKKPVKKASAKRC